MTEDDMTPAPVSGETLTEYRRRMSMTLQAQNITPEGTHLRLDLVRATIIAGGLIAGGGAGMAGYMQLKWTIDGLNQRLGDMANNLVTKSELAGVRDDARRVARAMLRKAIVECPRQVARGESVAVCKLQLSDDD